jgi:hypothetical protein
MQQELSRKLVLARVRTLEGFGREKSWLFSVSPGRGSDAAMGNVPPITPRENELVERHLPNFPEAVWLGIISRLDMRAVCRCVPNPRKKKAIFFFLVAPDAICCVYKMRF